MLQANAPCQKAKAAPEKTKPLRFAAFSEICPPYKTKNYYIFYTVVILMD